MRVASMVRLLVVPAIAAGAGAWLVTASAQPENSEITADAGSWDGEASAAELAAGPIEEIIVTAQRPISALILEGARLTEAFYARLNEVIDEEEFRIDCDNQYPAGSNIPTRVCRTRFQASLLNQQSISIMQGLGTTEDGLPTFNDAVMEIQGRMVQRTQEFERAILVAVNSDPELNAQVIRLIALKSAVQNYETPRERRRRERGER